MKTSFSLAATLCLLPGIAMAHAFLDDASPKVGSVVTSPPRELRLHFTQVPELAFSHVHFVAPDGTEIATGALSADPADPQRVIVPVTGRMGPFGQYEVRWDVISVDTHHTDGHFPLVYQP